MQQLREVVRQTFQTDRQNMKLIQRDDETLILSNCSLVTYNHIEHVVNTMSHVDVSMHPDTDPAAGLLVVFTVLPKTQWYLSSYFVQIVLTGLMVYVLTGSHIQESRL